MKREEITPCALCEKGLLQDNMPLCYRVTIDVQVPDYQAIQRTHGMEQFFGGGQQGAVLSNVFSDGADLLTSTGTATLNICHMCAIENNVIGEGVQIVADQNVSKNPEKTTNPPEKDQQ